MAHLLEPVMRSDIFLKIGLFFLILLNLLDNVTAAWLHKNLANPMLALQVIYIKYLAFGGFFLLYLGDIAYGSKLKRYEWCAVAYLALVGAMTVLIMTTHAGYTSGSRLYMYYFPPIIYFSGCFFGRRSTFGINYVIVSSISMYLAIGLLFVALNIWIGPVQLWRDKLDYATFILDGKGFTDAIIDGLHANFFFFFHGQAIPRFVGSYGDSLSLAYSGMTLIITAFFMRSKQRIVICLLLAAIVIASFTRAALLTIPVASAIYWLFRRRGFDITAALCVVLVFGVAVIGRDIFSLTDNSSTAAHVLSVSDIFQFLNPESLLLGTISSGTLPEFEPGLLNLLFTYGIVPFSLFMIFIRGIYLRNAGDHSLTPHISIIMLIAVMTLSVISSVFFATTSGWYAWFLAGFASKRSITLLPTPSTGIPTAEVQPAGQGL